MADKEKVSVSRSSHSGFMNVLAFFAVCIGGVALFLAMLLEKFGLTANWINSLQTIANAIGWFALCLLSVKYIIHRKKIIIWVIWIIALIMVITGTIVPLFS